MIREGLFSPRQPLAALLAAVAMPVPVIWAYVAATAVLLIGLAVIFKNELPQLRGIDRLYPFGRLCYAIPLAVFSTEHFNFTTGIASMIPQWIPWHLFWAYFVGCALFAASLAITTRIQAGLAAAGCGLMFFLFVMFMTVPALKEDPINRISWALFFRELGFSGGATAFAGAHWMNKHGARRAAWLVTTGRCLMTGSFLLFGVENFLHPLNMPVVPLEKFMPAFIPAQHLWSYLAGAALLVAGVCMVLNKHTRRAATVLGLVILFVELIVYVPLLLSVPGDMDQGLNYFFDTLMYGGAVLLLAEALPKEGQAHA